MFPCIRPDDMRYDHFSLTGSRHTVRQALPTPAGSLLPTEYRSSEAITTKGYLISPPLFAFRPVLPHLISSHLISTHLISSHLISSHLISSHLISSHLISAHLIHLVSSHLISSHPISSHLISSHLISSHLISSHLISSHLISSHLIHLISSHLISSHPISSHLISSHLISLHTRQTRYGDIFEIVRHFKVTKLVVNKKEKLITLYGVCILRSVNLLETF